MTRLSKKIMVMWNDKQAKLSNEVSHKKKQAIISVMAKNEQAKGLSII